jgi:ribosomal protein L11 methyltransferase
VIRLAVRVARDQAELVLAELLELAPAGVEELQVGSDAVEYAVYGAPGELPSLPDLHAAVGDALVELSTTELPDDWSERWKHFHRPVLISATRSPVDGNRRLSDLRIRPPWEASSVDEESSVQEIVIDPGQAFGTGGHASTRLCLALLLELAAALPHPGALLDVGTGSGVLAIAAARLGFEPVLAVDNDPESVHAARQNAAVNGVMIDVRRVDLRTQPLPWMSAHDTSPGPPSVTANLLRPLLLALANTIDVAPAHLIAGGLLTHEVDDVARAFRRRLGLRECERRASGEWAALWLAAPDQPRSGISVAARTIDR